jgi:hypothetical protein
MDPSPNLSQNENGVQPVKPGVMRGKLYYGWTKSRWILLVTNSLVSAIVILCCRFKVLMNSILRMQFMAYALIVLFGCLATYGQTYSDAEVIVAADRTMLDGKCNHAKYDVAKFSCINFFVPQLSCICLCSYQYLYC